MTIDTRFQNLINLTTIVTNDYDNTTTQFIDDEDLKRTLVYAIPLSCLAIVIIVLVVIGIHRRHCVMKKWTSLRQMRNTNPKFYQTTGLRRDSEFDSNSQEYSLKTVF